MAKRKRNPRKSTTALLLFSDTKTSADQRYLGQFSVPDAFVSFKKNGKSYAVLSRLEFARALKESAFHHVLSLEEWIERAKRKSRNNKAGYEDVIALLAKEYRISGFTVPATFPAKIAFKLSDMGIAINVKDGSIFPKRETKSEEEILKIKEGNRCSAAGIRAAEKILSEATIRKGRLYHQGKQLTSERLREAIEIACLRVGSVSMDTIAAGGAQACDPHCVGSGPLRANELIIVDVFPQVSASGYFGDMTRTFLKGTPSEAQKALVAAVRKAQKKAMSLVKTGVNGKSVHEAVNKEFVELGYETRFDEKGAVGFFHGTGHGLGMEIHEAPRVSSVSNRLKRSTVVTIEPGLYYPDVGGCRIEDVVAVRDDGAEKISSYHYRWILL